MKRCLTAFFNIIVIIILYLFLKVNGLKQYFIIFKFDLWLFAPKTGRIFIHVFLLSDLKITEKNRIIFMLDREDNGISSRLKIFL